jgi:Tfp pilus assembly protein PilO
MERKAAELIVWRLNRAAHSLGWPLAVAIGLLAFDVAFYFSTFEPARAEVEIMQLRTARLQATAGDIQEMAAPPLPEAQLAAFYDQLPGAQAVPETLRRLHRLGRNAGLTLDRGEYRPLRNPSGGLMRYQITLPARGSYAQVRQFLSRALEEMPGLALDGVGFQREHGEARELEAQLRLTLFVRTQS